MLKARKLEMEMEMEMQMKEDKQNLCKKNKIKKSSIQEDAKM